MLDCRNFSKENTKQVSFNFLIKLKTNNKFIFNFYKSSIRYDILLKKLLSIY